MAEEVGVTETETLEVGVTYALDETGMYRLLNGRPQATGAVGATETLELGVMLEDDGVRLALLEGAN